MRKIVEVRDGGTMCQIDKLKPLSKGPGSQTRKLSSDSGGGHRGFSHRTDADNISSEACEPTFSNQGAGFPPGVRLRVLTNQLPRRFSIPQEVPQADHAPRYRIALRAQKISLSCLRESSTLSANSGLLADRSGILFADLPDF